MDVLTDVLRNSQLGNAVLSRSELLGPWALEVGPEVRAAVHVVQRGVCWLRLGRAAPVRLLPGDVVLIPRGTRHVLSNAPRTPAVPYERALERMRARLADMKAGAEHDTDVLLCAEIKFEEAAPHPLMSVLPEVIHLPAEATGNDDGLQAVSRLLLREALGPRAGSELIVPRLIDTLLVFIVRAWIERQPLDSAGWLGALGDPQIGQALALLHESPEQKWTVASLASRVAMSRAVFARRFGLLVGEPPLTYLTRWRLNLAAKVLRTTGTSAEQIASLVGYESPTAFGNAFRRHLSVSPGEYRRQHGIGSNLRTGSL